MTQPIASYHDQVWRDLQDEQDPFVTRQAPTPPSPAPAPTASPAGVWSDLRDVDDPFVAQPPSTVTTTASLLSRATSGRSVR